MINVNINARDHEEAHVASAKFVLPAASLSQAEAEVTKQLAVTVRWAEEKDLLIGHVKAYLTWGTGDARMLSTTGGAVESKGSELPEGTHPVEVGVTAIVFGGELEEVEDRLEGLSAAVVGQFGDWCTYVHECEHHHHHDHDHDHDHEHDHDHDHEHHHEHHHEHEHHHDHDHGHSHGEAAGEDGP